MKKLRIAFLLVLAGCADKTQDEGVDFLVGRGHQVTQLAEGSDVTLSPGYEPSSVSVEDIHAINAINDVYRIDVISLEGIGATEMAELETNSSVRTIWFHYRLPGASLKYLDRFTGLEELRLLEGSECRHLPVIQSLRRLDYQGHEERMTEDDIDAILAQPNLEELEISPLVSERDYARINSAPGLLRIDVKTSW